MNTNTNTNTMKAEQATEEKSMGAILHFQEEIDLALCDSKSAHLALAKQILSMKIDYNTRSQKMDQVVAKAKSKITEELIARDGKYYRQDEVEMRLLQMENLQEALLRKANMLAEIQYLEMKFKLVTGA